MGNTPNIAHKDVDLTLDIQHDRAGISLSPYSRPPFVPRGLVPPKRLFGEAIATSVGADNMASEMKLRSHLVSTHLLFSFPGDTLNRSTF